MHFSVSRIGFIGLGHPPLPPGKNLLIGIRVSNIAGERPTNPLRSDKYVNQV